MEVDHKIRNERLGSNFVLPEHVAVQEQTSGKQLSPHPSNR